MNFIYSICIPTFNRASDLAVTLDSIVRQPGFDGDIEILITDNASPDSTQSVVEKLLPQYPSIVYCRNDSNIGADLNILKAVSLAKGRYIKLLNDNKLVLEGVIANWRSLFAESNEDIVFQYPGQSAYPDGTSIVVDSDRFVKDVSFQVAWMGGISIKREALRNIDLESIDCTTYLAQTDLTLQILNRSRRARIYYSDWVREPRQPVRGGYNYFKVINDNFPRMLDSAENSGCISRRTKRAVERDLLLNHTFPYIVRFMLKSKNYQHETESALYYIFKNFYSFPELYFFPLWVAARAGRKFKRLISDKRRRGTFLPPPEDYDRHNLESRRTTK